MEKEKTEETSEKFKGMSHNRVMVIVCTREFTSMMTYEVCYSS